MKPYYEHAGITIYHGDCREIVPQLEFDVVVTDPPYGVTENKWDDSAVTLGAFDQIVEPLVCTSQNPFSSELVCRYRNRFKWSDVWEKTQAVGFLNAKVMPMRQHEDILIFCDGRMPFSPQISRKPLVNIRPHGRTAQSSNYGKFDEERVRTIAPYETYPRSIVTFANSQEGEHPTQKPLSLFRYLVLSYSYPNHRVCDPFMGSGTTLAAAKALERRAIGIEIEEKYCEIAAKRLSQEVFDFGVSR